MAKMNIRSLVLSLVANGHFGSCGFNSEHKMLKGGRCGKPVNPLFGRVRKTYRVQFQLTDYAAVKAKKEGVSKAEVEVQPIPWGHHISTFVVVGDSPNTLGKEYFACRPLKFYERQYFVDGKPATEEEVAIIREYAEKKDDELPLWFTPRLEDVTDFRAEGESLSV